MTLRNLWFEISNYSILAHCNGRAMPWCVLDNIAHTIHPARDSDGIIEPLPGRWQWICDRHQMAHRHGRRTPRNPRRQRQRRCTRPRYMGIRET